MDVETDMSFSWIDCTEMVSVVRDWKNATFAERKATFG